MRMVPIHEVREGMRLAQDIPNPRPGGVPLLRAGVELSERLADRLAASSVRGVWVADALGSDIEVVTPLTAELRSQSEEAHASFVRDTSKAIADRIGVLDDALRAVQEAVVKIVSELQDCPEVAVVFDDLASADAYAHAHSIRVATLGVLLGQRVMRTHGWRDWQGKRRFDQVQERLTPLGTGLILHDIGKVTLAPELLAKPPHELTDEDRDTIGTHATAGAALLPAQLVHPLAIAVVRSHHERYDGLGYPTGKAGEEIHLFARIAAVANVYDAITAERPHHPAQPPHVGVRAILTGSGSEFDPQVVEHFSALVMPYPAGCPVTLPGGEEAVVASARPESPENPVVRYRNSKGIVRERAMHIVDGVVLDGYEP